MKISPVLKHVNDDFRVREIPFPHQMHASHQDLPFQYLWLDKTGYTTIQALDEVQKFLKVRQASIGCAGLKDEDGMTSQMISIEACLGQDELRDFNREYAGQDRFCRLSEAGFGVTKVETGDLLGNVFNVNLRRLPREMKTRPAPKERRFSYHLNYYDRQRFGQAGSLYNGHVIGEALTRGDVDRAKSLILAPGNKPPSIDDAMCRRSADEFIAAMGKRRIDLYLSAYESHGWNSRLSEMVANCGTSDDLREDDLLPVWLCCSEESLLEVARKASSLDYHRPYSDRGAGRRATVLQTQYVLDDACADDHHEGYDSQWITFFLPAGAYATMFVRQLVLGWDRRKAS